MNKRITKKVVKNFTTLIQTSDGPVSVHVNRRGCKGRWSAKDDAALAGLIKAVQRTWDRTEPIDEG